MTDPEIRRLPAPTKSQRIHFDKNNMYTRIYVVDPQEESSTRARWLKTCITFIIVGSLVIIPQSSTAFVLTTSNQQRHERPHLYKHTTVALSMVDIDTSNYYPESLAAKATPTLPSGTFRPKQSLGQNFLKDGNTVAKIIRAFYVDASKYTDFKEAKDTSSNFQTNTFIRAVELGPGAGALTDALVPLFSPDQPQPIQGTLLCIEIDPRAVELLTNKHPTLNIRHMDVLQVDYPLLAQEQGGPLAIVGNLPYYITSQILFALADASHTNAVQSATVTMQYEVAQRLVAKPHTKEYGILSVVFQLYANVQFHFKIPPTVFYPKPKVDSALVGLHFYGPAYLHSVFNKSTPKQLRRVLTTCFQQRRKTLRNSLKKLVLELCHQDSAWVDAIFRTSSTTDEPIAENNTTRTSRNTSQSLPSHWATLRPEQLSPLQFVALTDWLYQGRYSCQPNTSISALPLIPTQLRDDEDLDNESLMDEGVVDENSSRGDIVDGGIRLGHKVWRRLKHGAND